MSKRICICVCTCTKKVPKPELIPLVLLTLGAREVIVAAPNLDNQSTLSDSPPIFTIQSFLTCTVSLRPPAVACILNMWVEKLNFRRDFAPRHAVLAARLRLP